MNITYLVGVLLSFVFMVFGMVQSAKGGFDFAQITMFGDPSSVLIVVGCTVAVVVASFPIKMITAMPKHFKITLNTKRFDPMYYIDRLTELAQVARKNGLLALEERANQETDSFFKQAIMLIVDANDPDRVRGILDNEIECMSARHDDAASMYDKASSVAPAFGMVGTLVGLIKMLNGINGSADAMDSIGPAMGTALITTLYGCILAHMLFSPIASNLRVRDEEEVLCKMIIVEGIMSIQSGENPKFLREKLLTFMAQKQREDGGGEKPQKERRSGRKKG